MLLAPTSAGLGAGHPGRQRRPAHGARHPPPPGAAARAGQVRGQGRHVGSHVQGWQALLVWTGMGVGWRHPPLLHTCDRTSCPLPPTCPAGAAASPLQQERQSPTTSRSWARRCEAGAWVTLERQQLQHGQLGAAAPSPQLGTWACKAFNGARRGPERLWQLNKLHDAIEL